MGTVTPFRRGASRPDDTKARESRAAATQHARRAACNGRRLPADAPLHRVRADIVDS